MTILNTGYSERYPTKSITIMWNGTLTPHRQASSIAFKHELLYLIKWLRASGGLSVNWKPLCFSPRLTQQLPPPTPGAKVGDFSQLPCELTGPIFAYGQQAPDGARWQEPCRIAAKTAHLFTGAARLAEAGPLPGTAWAVEARPGRECSAGRAAAACRAGVDCTARREIRAPAKS